MMRNIFARGFERIISQVNQLLHLATVVTRKGGATGRIPLHFIREEKTPENILFPLGREGNSRAP